MPRFVAITDAQWGIIGTTAVALATIIVGLMSSSRERRHQREMTASERRYTDEMKRRDSREKTYLELLAYLHTQLRPVVTATRLSDVPKSTDDLDVELRARIGATASEPVRTNLDSFVETRSQIDRLVKGGRGIGHRGRVHELPALARATERLGRGCGAERHEGTRPGVARQYWRTVSPFGIEAGGHEVRTATVFIVDTVESVATKERLGQDRADAVYRKVERLLRKAISTGGGTTVKGLGDGVLAVFPSAILGAARRVLGVPGGRRAQRDVDRRRRVAGRRGCRRRGVRGRGHQGPRGRRSSSPADRSADERRAADRRGVPARAGRTDCVLEAGQELRLKGIDHPVQTYTINWAASPEATSAEVDLPSGLAAELRSRFPFADRRPAMEALGMPVLGDASSLSILRGPSGVGKTRLLAEWAERARRSGSFVFYYRADTDTTATLHQLATTLREFQPSPAHGRLLSTSAAYRRVWDDLTATATSIGDEPVDDDVRRKTAANLVTFLTQVSADSPTIFIIDSIQNGSDITLDFVDALLKSANSSVRIVCAITTDLAADDVTITDARLVARFPLSEHVESLDLEPLDYDGVVEWLERQPMVTLDKPEPVPLDEIGKKIASAFYDASGGNPNVLVLVIRESYDYERRVSMDDEGRWRTQYDLETLRRSQSAEKLIRTRLSRLNADERDVLELSSVIGLEVDGDLLRRVSNRSLDEIDALLDVAKARHFISESEEIQRFETEATRRAIYRIIPAGSAPTGTRRSRPRWDSGPATARPSCRTSRSPAI